MSITFALPADKLVASTSRSEWSLPSPDTAEAESTTEEMIFIDPGGSKKEEIRNHHNPPNTTRDIPIAECPSSVDKLFEVKDDEVKELTWVVPASTIRHVLSGDCTRGFFQNPPSKYPPRYYSKDREDALAGVVEPQHHK